ncbi:MAG TPA: thiamine phosphate synthase [Bryobacteraceae bacterium]|jgi:thiamine-phosphate pyrophosphorylase
MIECYITDRAALAVGQSLLDAIARNLESGPDWIQIREKDTTARDLYELVSRAIQLPNPRGVKFLVNGRVDVALAAGAGGVHLPANSPPPRYWREITPPGFAIGVSCHAIEEVLQAEREGASYALFGPVFAPLSKSSGLHPRGLVELGRAAASVKIPVLALGGITRENMPACISAGTAGIAAISLYQGSPAREPVRISP